MVHQEDRRTVIAELPPSYQEPIGTADNPAWPSGPFLNLLQAETSGHVAGLMHVSSVVMSGLLQTPETTAFLVERLGNKRMTPAQVAAAASLRTARQEHLHAMPVVPRYLIGRIVLESLPHPLRRIQAARLAQEALAGADIRLISDDENNSLAGANYQIIDIDGVGTAVYSEYPELATNFGGILVSVSDGPEHYFEAGRPGAVRTAETASHLWDEAYSRPETDAFLEFLAE
jgi:hypothetical protein